MACSADSTYRSGSSSCDPSEETLPSSDSDGRGERGGGGGGGGRGGGEEWEGGGASGGGGDRVGGNQDEHGGEGQVAVVGECHNQGNVAIAMIKLLTEQESGRQKQWEACEESRRLAYGFFRRMIGLTAHSLRWKKKEAPEAR